MAKAQDALIGGFAGEGLNGALLAGAALQLLPLALTRASVMFPRMQRIQEAGRQHIVGDSAGMGLGPVAADAMQQLPPENLTTASALHPTTRHRYQAGRLVRLTCMVGALAMSAFRFVTPRA